VTGLPQSSAFVVRATRSCGQLIAQGEKKDVIELKDGLPILVGLVSQYPVTKLSQKNAPCGRDIGANAYEATRVDYYHDWIASKIKEMQ
jgi:hypothetical protein